MTTEPVAKEFVGIEAIIESVRGARRSEETGRMHINMSVPITERTMPLLGEVLLQLKNRCFIGFGFAQSAMEFPDDEPADPSGDPHRNGASATMSVDGQDGQPVKLAAMRHVFHPDDSDSNTCLFCHAPALDPSHISLESGEALTMPEAEAVDAHLAGDDEAVRKLIEASVEPSTDSEIAHDAEPGLEQPDDDHPGQIEDAAPATDDDATPEQQEARASLRNRSKQRVS